MSTTLTVTPISDYGIIVDPRDNVAVVKKETFEGLGVTLPDGSEVRVNAAVPPGHRFATREIPAGEFVLQYGQPIGTSMGIRPGDWIAHENMTDNVPVVRDLPKICILRPPITLRNQSVPHSWAFGARTGALVHATSFSLFRPACARAMKRHRLRSLPSTRFGLGNNFPMWTVSWRFPITKAAVVRMDRRST